MKESVYTLPEEFLRRIKIIYPTHFNRICETFLNKKKQTFRVNYLKTGLNSLRDFLRKEGIRYRELPWPRGAFILNSDIRHFQRSFIYKDGLVYLQNVSSMIVPFVLGAKTGDKILDLCAAPGAKTTEIASLAGRNTEIVAIEKVRTRYYKLLANLKIQGADFVKTIIMDGIFARKKFPEYFNKVLLDAPCSSEGRFYTRNPRSFRYWKYRKVKEMAHKQKRLISSAYYALKPGGKLLYSTCTFSPEENEEVVDWVLNKFKDKIELLSINIPIKNVRNGLIKWRKKTFLKSLSRVIRIIPNDYMEGFFVALFNKL